MFTRPLKAMVAPLAQRPDLQRRPPEVIAAALNSNVQMLADAIWQAAWYAGAATSMAIKPTQIELTGEGAERLAAALRQASRGDAGPTRRRAAEILLDARVVVPQTPQALCTKPPTSDQGRCGQRDGHEGLCDWSVGGSGNHASLECPGWLARTGCGSLVPLGPEMDAAKHHLRKCPRIGTGWPK